MPSRIGIENELFKNMTNNDGAVLSSCQIILND